MNKIIATNSKWQQTDNVNDTNKGEIKLFGSQFFVCVYFKIVSQGKSTT